MPDKAPEQSPLSDGIQQLIDRLAALLVERPELAPVLARSILRELEQSQIDEDDTRLPQLGAALRTLSEHDR